MFQADGAKEAENSTKYWSALSLMVTNVKHLIHDAAVVDDVLIHAVRSLHVAAEVTFLLELSEDSNELTAYS